jgi:DNA-binding NtrC family response regulator
MELLIAEEDIHYRALMADLFIEAGYTVTVVSSAASALYGIMRKTAQVVLLSSYFDELTADKLIPLLKKCNRRLNIIVITESLSLPILRNLRREGIFYHALKPAKPEDQEELKEAVRCAFANITRQFAHA